MSSTSNESVDLANFVVESIKNRTIASQETLENFDTWDQEESGLAWIDNELSMFSELYESSLLDPDFDSYDLLSEAFDVNSAKQVLSELPLNFLKSFKIFITKGGTDNPRSFELRDSEELRSKPKKQRKAIIEYLTKSYEDEQLLDEDDEETDDETEDETDDEVFTLEGSRNNQYKIREELDEEDD
jgi:hypothetical protein